MKIILAIDGSEQNKAAVEAVANRAFPPDTEVRIVTAYEMTPSITKLEPMGVSQGFYAKADNFVLKAAEDTTENAAKILHQKNPALTITTIVIEGSPKNVILEEADAFDADLIIVGSHGYGMVERFLLGSVSQAIALHAKCSVEIVRNPKVSKIILALDGSEKSEAAVDEIARQYFSADSEVRVISVVEPIYFPGVDPMSGVDMELYVQIEKNAQKVAQVTVEKATAKLQAFKESSQFKVTTKVLSGSPKSVILEEAEAFGSDLIVVGSHGYGMIERFLLGSVSQAVALHAKCSVEIVRSPKKQTSEIE